MKKTLYLSLLCICSYLGYAQPLQTQLKLQTGVCVPLFDFASTSLGPGSFATTGFNFTAGVNINITDSFGAMIESGLHLTPVDVWRLGYAKVQADPFLEDIYIRSDPYRIIPLMAGPFYRTGIIDKLSFQSGILAGVFFASTPYQLNIPQYFMVGPPFFEITESHDVSFSYGASVSLQYEITACYQIAVSSSLLHSTAHFNFIQGKTRRTDTKNISLLNGNIGLIVKL